MEAQQFAWATDQFDEKPSRQRLMKNISLWTGHHNFVENQPMDRETFEIVNALCKAKYGLEVPLAEMPSTFGEYVDKLLK